MSTSTSHPSTSSSDIPFHGFVETTADALRLIQAARQGVIPRITRRLNEEERATIVRSGAVFVFSVEESGIRRWTEGLSWSASRIAGNFLLYRELASRNSGRTSYTGKALQSDSAFSRRKVVPKGSDSQVMLKPDGLVKKTITVCADGTQYHLISYYTDDDFRSKRLQRPIRRPDIMALGIPADLLDASNFRYPPRIDVNGGGSVVDIQEHTDSDSIRLPQYRLTPRTVSQPVPARTTEVTTKPDRQSSSLVIRTSRRPRAIRPAKPRSPVGPSPTQSPAIPDMYRHTGGIGEPSPTMPGPGPSSAASGFFPPGTISPSNASLSDSSSPREVSPWRPQGIGVLDRGAGHPITQRYSLPQLNESHQLPGVYSTGSSTASHQSGYTTLVPTPTTHREYGSRHSYPSTPNFSSSNYSSPNSTNDQHQSNHASTNINANYNEPVQSAYQYQRVPYNTQSNSVSYPLAYDTDYNQYNTYGYYMPFQEQQQQQQRTP